jgi:PST family polysaccharide transporter
MFFSEEGVIPVMSALAFVLPIRSLSSVHNSLLRRQLEFNKIVRITIVALAVAGTVAILIAYLGGGVWALVAQQLVQASVLSLLFWILVKWRPSIAFAWSDIKYFKDFAAGLVGFNTVNYLSRNADYILIGRFLGTAPLGIYTLAYRIMLYPVQKLAGTAANALFPAFAHVQDDDQRLSRGYIKASRYIALIAFPLMIGLAMTADDFIALVYGEEWLQVALILPYLTIVGALQTVQSLYGSVIIAKGLTHLQFRVSLLKLLFTLTGFAIGIRWGLRGVASAYMLTESISFVVVMPYYFKKCGTNLANFVSAMALPTVATLVMAVSLFIFKALVDLSQLSLLTSFLLQVLIGGLSYLAIIFALGSHLKNELWQDIRLTFKQDKPAQSI